MHVLEAQEKFLKAIELTKSLATRFSFSKAELDEVIKAWRDYIETLGEEEKNHWLMTFTGLKIQLKEIPARLEEDQFFLYELARVLC